jgi:hypothetical protein
MCEKSGVDRNKIQWTYVILPARGTMDVDLHRGPMPEDRLRELLGGDYEFVQIADGVIAVRKDREGLTPNDKYPAIRGDVVLGKFDGGVFVGYAGVMIADSPSL